MAKSESIDYFKGGMSGVLKLEAGKVAAKNGKTKVFCSSSSNGDRADDIFSDLRIVSAMERNTNAVFRGRISGLRKPNA